MFKKSKLPPLKVPHTYRHIYIHLYIPTYRHTYIDGFIHTYINTYIYIHIYIKKNAISSCFRLIFICFWISCTTYSWRVCFFRSHCRHSLEELYSIQCLCSLSQAPCGPVQSLAVGAPCALDPPSRWQWADPRRIRKAPQSHGPSPHKA